MRENSWVPEWKIIQAVETICSYCLLCRSEIERIRNL